LARRLPVATVVAALLVLAGCGGGAGVRSGATVNVYVSVPLSGPQAAAGRASCDGARRTAERAGARAGEVRVRVLCLDDSDGSGAWALAAVGANARRAVEDSSAVAYLGELDPAASRFSATILEAAEIAQLSAADAAASMRRVLDAISESGNESPRNSVWEMLEH
jgi:ABC-type branched-subunit amino acid transport system substrate-binding protein